MVTGIAAVCGVGAALGLYLRPDLGVEPAEASVAQPRARPEAPKLEYAAATAQLEMLVVEPDAGLATGGPLPSELVPPSAAPLPAQTPAQTLAQTLPQPPARTMASIAPAASVTSRAPVRAVAPDSRRCAAIPA